MALGIFFAFIGVEVAQQKAQVSFESLHILAFHRLFAVSGVEGFLEIAEQEFHSRGR